MVLIEPPTVMKRHFAPSLGLSYLHAVGREMGIPIRRNSLIAKRHPEQLLLDEAAGADLIGLYVNVGNFQAAKAMGTLLKERHPEKVVVMGGPFASDYHDRLVHDGHADAVVRGEGEAAFRAILKGDPNETIPSLTWRDDSGGVRLNLPGAYLEDLDALPYPYWNPEDTKKYYLNNGSRSPLSGIMTSRGCPYACINCNKNIHGYRFRTRSIANTLGEIEYLHREYGVREIFVWDDIFNWHLPRAKAILEEIIRLNLPIRFALPNSFRGDNTDEEFFALMKRAGFYWLCLAIESADQGVLDGTRKKLNFEKMHRAVQWAKKYDFNLTAYFMLGLPHDTHQSIRKTIDYAASLGIDQAMFFIATPFAGTAMGRVVEEHGGRVLEDLYEDQVHFEGGKRAFEHPNLTREEVEAYYREANRRFYMNPRTVTRFVRRRLRSPRDAWYLAKNATAMLTTGHLW